MMLGMSFESQRGNSERELISNELLYKSEVLLYCGGVLTELEMRDVLVMEGNLHKHHALTWEHSARMARGIYHMLLTTPEIDWGVAPEEAFAITLLHDVGKIYVDAETLNQSEKLNESQIAALRRHQLNSALMVQESELKRFTWAIYYHHESYDGSGSYGLRGDEIPKVSRLLAIFDAYDAMIHDRGYNSENVKPPEFAISELLRSKGVLYDPDMVDAFVQFKADTNAIIYDYMYSKRGIRVDLEQFLWGKHIPLTGKDAINA